MLSKTFCTALAVACVAQAAQAGIISYTNMAVWNAQVASAGMSVETETFNAIADGFYSSPFGGSTASVTWGASAAGGLYVQGGKTGVTSARQRTKDLVKASLGLIGLSRFKDHHVWHPTFSQLTSLIESNGFTIEDIYWQPQWKDTVCYVSARRS